MSVINIPRRVLRRIIPPKPEYIWSGVYKRFDEVPSKGLGHASPKQIAATVAHTQSVMNQLDNGNLMSPHVPAEYSVFSSISATASSFCEGPRKLRVLDIGGGLGIGYLYLRASVTDVTSIHYEVVEVDVLCEAGVRLFRSNSEISFAETLPSNDRGEFDIIQFCSSLQYMTDYASVVRKACSYNSPLIHVSKIPLGTFDTFATGQYNIPDTITPVWFINYAELVQLFRNEGYGLAAHGAHDREYDMSNFEPQYRVRRYSHLLFRKN